MAESKNGVRAARETRGLTQMALAEAAGITRQSLSAIESGRADPSVSSALRLAQALETSVEALFGQAKQPPSFEAELVTTTATETGTRVAAAMVRGSWVAHPLFGDGAEAADGLVLEVKRRGASFRAEVQPLRPLQALRDNLLVLGCAPALGLLVTRLNLAEGPGHFVWLDRTSTEALDAVVKGRAHVAGVHLPSSAATKERAVAELARITLVHWDAGLVVPRGNPRGLRSVADLAQEGLRICARQAGAGTQRLLEDKLREHALDPARVLAGARVASGHFAAANTVALGAADVTVAMRGAALAHGLDFVPVAEERFDLVLPADLLGAPPLARAIEVMKSANFRRELQALGGYDTRDSGRVIG